MPIALALQTPPTPAPAAAPRTALVRFEARPPRRPLENVVSYEELERLWVVSRSHVDRFIFRDTDSGFGRLVVAVRGERVDDLIVGAVRAEGFDGGDRIERISGRTGEPLLRSRRPIDRVFASVHGAARVGDLDGDRLEDAVLVHVPEWDGGFAPQDRRVRLFRADATPASDLVTERPGFGEVGAVEALGDTDGDGSPELAIGHPSRDEVVFLAANRAEPLRVLTLDDPLSQSFGVNAFGASLDAGPDLTGDGVPELAIGALEPHPRRTLKDFDPPKGFGSVRVYDGKSLALRSRLTGVQPEGYFGAVVAWCDDLDGDGDPELAVTAPWDGNGRVFVLSEATGALVHAFEGARPGDRYGKALDVASDFDGDGVRDLVIGAPRAHDGHAALAGHVELRSGRTGELLMRIDGPSSSSEGLEPWGTLQESPPGLPDDFAWPRSDAFGWSLATGRFDSDDLPDLAIGFPCRAPGSVVGYVAAISGVELRKRIQEPVERTIEVGDPVRASLDAAVAVGVDQVRLMRRIERTYDFDESEMLRSGFGRIVAAVPSTTHAGHDLVATGCPYGLDDDSAEFFVLSGGPRWTKSGTLERSFSAIRVHDVAPTRKPRGFVLGVGEFTGFFVRSHSGRVVGFGAAADMAAFGPPTGASFHDQFGAAIASAGDLDGDGFDELIVCDTSVQVFSGRTGACLDEFRHRVEDPGGSKLLEPRDLDLDGFDEVVLGEGSIGQVTILSTRERRAAVVVRLGAREHRFGAALAFVPDFDGDAIDEIAIGAPRSPPEASGTIVVLSGSTLEPLCVWEGERERGELGRALCADHDLDGDGVLDLVATAPGGGDGFVRGAVYVISGRDRAVLLRIDGDPEGDGVTWGHPDWRDPRSNAFGWSVATGDFDADGAADLAIGSPRRDPGARIGRVDVISGVELRKHMRTRPR